MKCPHCGNETQEDPRDLCVNCDHWREEHYNRSGVFQGEVFGCLEYQGTAPSEERRSKKAAQLKKSVTAAQGG